MFLSSVSGNTSRATVHRASKAHRASCGGGGSGDGADRLSSSDNPPAVLGPGTSSARLKVRATVAPAPVCAAPDGLVSRRVATFVANARPHRVIAVRHACVTDHHTSGPRDVERRARVRAAVFSYPPLPAPRAVARVSPRRNAVANARPRRVIAARHTYVTDRCASCVWVAPASSGELERVRPHFPYPPPPAPRAIARVSPRRNVSWRTHAHIA